MMKVTITLERGDAALGTLDFNVLKDLLSRAVEESAVQTIRSQMPEHYLKSSAQGYGWEEGHHPRDFEMSAEATIRWMLQNFTIAAKKVPQLPECEDLLQTETISWPK